MSGTPAGAILEADGFRAARARLVVDGVSLALGAMRPSP